MAIRYEIDSQAVRVFDENGVCFIYQPHHPEMRDWAGKSEMEDWAKEFVANFGKPVPKPAAKSGE